MNEKFLKKEELNFLTFIQKYDKNIQKIITNLCKICDKNVLIYNLQNITDFNNKIFQKEFPCVLLMGGKAYEIFYYVCKKYYDLPKYNNFSIESIDYDISILVNNNFNINNGIDMINILMQQDIFNFIKNDSNFEIITKKDILSNEFLKTKKIVNKNFNNILITYTKSKQYIGFQFSIKYKNILYQIVEILFWFNGTINDNLNITHLNLINSFLYVDNDNDIEILIINPKLLVDNNVLSITARFESMQYIKCSKDYFRLLFMYNLPNNIEKNKNSIIDNILNNVTKTFNLKYPNIFNSPFKICNINETEEIKQIIQKIYINFLNLDVEKQIKIILKNKNLSDKEQKIYDILFETNNLKSIK